MSAVRGVVFDVDGTLVDSNDQHAFAWGRSRANLRSIAFRCGGCPDDRLNGPTQIYNGLADMFDEYERFERAFE